MNTSRSNCPRAGGMLASHYGSKIFNPKIVAIAIRRHVELCLIEELSWTRYSVSIFYIP